MFTIRVEIRLEKIKSLHISKMLHIYTHTHTHTHTHKGYYLALRRKESMPYATRWMKL
jgi:hypothetical protein